MHRRLTIPENCLSLHFIRKLTLHITHTRESHVLILEVMQLTQTKQEVYLKRSIEVRSPDICCRGNAISITYCVGPVAQSV